LVAAIGRGCCWLKEVVEDASNTVEGERCSICKVDMTIKLTAAYRIG
jgi:hypothetical protein